MKAVLILATLMLPLSALAECKSGAVEPFATFLKTFGEDKTYAIARTEYPLVFLRHEDVDVRAEGRAIIKKQVTRKDDAPTPAMAVFARDKGMELSTTSMKQAEASVRMAKPGTDWLLTYHFVRKGACWYLRRVEDHSL